jgi:hypothetical protein
MFLRLMHPRLVFLLAPALALHAAVAHAEPDYGRAKEAYDRGVRAHAAGDHGAAARAFAEADALVPAAASLEAAIEAAMRADDAVLGADLLDRLVGRPPEPSLDKTVAAAKKRFANRTGKVLVDCKGAAHCLLAIDGVAADATHAVNVKVGAHTLVFERGGERAEKLIQVEANKTLLISEVLPGPPPAVSSMPSAKGHETTPPKYEERGISPVFFYIGLGASVALGMGTTVSGIDAVNQHDRFVDAGCAPGASGARPADCDARARDGESALVRTNILLVATAAFVVATAVTGAFFVKWSTTPSSGVAYVGRRF